MAETRTKVEPGRGVGGLGTYGEKGTTTALSSTFATDETPSPHAHPFLLLSPRLQQHNIVVVLQPRGNVAAVEAVVCVGALHGMNGGVGTVLVPC